MKFSLPTRLLMSRLLTRSGDQAWDFAVPLLLLRIFPGQIRFAALYYLVVRLAVAMALPHFASIIDRTSRKQAVRLGIGLQLIGVVLGALIVGVSETPQIAAREQSPSPWLFIALLSFSGILSGLGAAFMDISIANDLVPSTFGPENLPTVNSRLRQVDLLTEIAAPVLAGLMLLLSPVPLPLLGFYLIAVWNVVSFFPEYGLLRSIFNERPDLEKKAAPVPRAATQSIFTKLAQGWSTFFREPVALAVVAYSLLWLSVLSPHGVLLTGYLKDEWQVPEWALGIYRALGALFGLLATMVFPYAIELIGLVRASRIFIYFQAALVLIALGFFLIGGLIGKLGFLGFVLLSRVALYGFSLGEMQIRQQWIRPEARGEVNGFSSSLTGIATLGIYGAGALLPLTADFKYLVFGSAAAVLGAAIVFSIWSRSPEKNLPSA